MTKEQQQFDFLNEYILNVLKQNGYDDLEDSVRQEFVPQLVAHAETRLGASLLPKLDETSAQKMIDLTKDENTTPEEWEKFWQENVSDFSEVVKKTLEDFSIEIKELLSKIKNS